LGIGACVFGFFDANIDLFYLIYDDFLFTFVLNEVKKQLLKISGYF